jgi:hypothetical protein
MILHLYDEQPSKPMDLVHEEIHEEIAHRILTGLTVHRPLPLAHKKYYDGNGPSHPDTPETIADHASYPLYATPDTKVLRALLYYVPMRVHNIIFDIRTGRPKLTDHNRVEEFKNIGIEIPLSYPLKDLNQPVYHFCQNIKKLKSFHLPGANAKCYTKSATADSGNDSGPFVGMKLMGSKCHDWNNTGIGISEGRSIVTGVSQIRNKNPSILYSKLMNRNRDSTNSWVSACKSFYDQSMHLLGAEEGFNGSYDAGFSYDCASQTFCKRTGVDAGTDRQGHDVIQSSWGDHEAWDQVLQASEMAGCLRLIKPGGNFLLKLRIFQNSETHFAVAALARFFDSMEMVAVPQQVCGFALAYFTGKKNLSSEVFELGTEYFLSQCADSTLRVFRPPECCQPTEESLTKVMEAGLEMTMYKDDTFHYFSMAVRALLEDMNQVNVFLHTKGRISSEKHQISLTHRLRDAMLPRTYGPAGHGYNAHAAHSKETHQKEAIWTQFLQDMG